MSHKNSPFLYFICASHLSTSTHMHNAKYLTHFLIMHKNLYMKTITSLFRSKHAQNGSASALVHTFFIAAIANAHHFAPNADVSLPTFINSLSITFLIAGLAVGFLFSSYNAASNEKRIYRDAYGNTGFFISALSLGALGINNALIHL